MIRWLFLIPFIFTCFLYGQAPGIQWDFNFGGTYLDNGSCILQTADGGFIVAARSESSDGDLTQNHGLNDAWVFKLDASGVLQWQSSFGGSQWDEARTILETNDGGYLLGGNTSSSDGDIDFNHGAGDMWLIKLDSFGNLEWQKTYGGSDYDGFKSVVSTNDGGYVFTGFTSSNDGDVSGLHASAIDMWVVKVDTSGIIQWQKCLGGSGDEFGWDLIEESDGDLVVVGGSYSFDGDVMDHQPSTYGDCWLVKLNSAGTLIWTRCFGSIATEVGYSIVSSSDGGYVISGAANSVTPWGPLPNYHNLGDVLLIKVDSSGVQEWIKCFGGTSEDIAFDVVATSSGNFVFAGYTNSGNGDLTDSLGYIDMWIAEINPAGNIVWQKTVGSPQYESAQSVIQATDASILVTGTIITSTNQVSVVRLNPYTGFKDEKLSNWELFPTITHQWINIQSPVDMENARLEILNLHGEIVLENWIHLKQNEKFCLDVSSLASGMYLIKLAEYSIKVIKE